MRRKNLKLVPDIIQGKIEGKRGRGRPRICYMDNVRQWTEMKMSSVIQACHDWEGWREIVKKAARAANAHPDDAAKVKVKSQDHAFSYEVQIFCFIAYVLICLVLLSCKIVYN